jgi:hypothetical protein
MTRRNVEVFALEITEDGKFRRLSLSSNPQWCAPGDGGHSTL